MNDSILAIEQVEKSYGGLRAVAGASFTVKRGSLTALIGPNGAGKTTLFDLVTGFVHPDRGAIRFEGRAIAGLAPHRVARLGLVRTFQLTRVFAAMTIMENMMLAPLGQPGESLLGLITPGGRNRRSEAALAEREEELTRLRKEAADFPARLQNEVQQATTHAAKEAKQQADQQTLLLKKEAESDRRLAELQIKTLEDLVARQNAQIADMQKQMDDAKKQVQEIAVRAIEGASGSKTLAHVNEIAMEQAKHRGPQS